MIENQKNKKTIKFKGRNAREDTMKIIKKTYKKSLKEDLLSIGDITTKSTVDKNKKIERHERDIHIGCPSWPNCDEGPLGCVILQGVNVEWYGHRD